MALVTTSIGPGDGIRGSDLIVWGDPHRRLVVLLGICGALHCVGVLWRYGVLLGLVFAVWEFAMAITSLAAPNAGILLVSISGHGSMLIDAVVAVAWPETDVLILQGQWAGTSAVSGFRSTAPPGAEVLDAFTNAEPRPPTPRFSECERGGARHHHRLVLVRIEGIVPGQGGGVNPCGSRETSTTCGGSGIVPRFGG